MLILSSDDLYWIQIKGKQFNALRANPVWTSTHYTKKYIKVHFRRKMSAQELKYVRWTFRQWFAKTYFRSAAELFNNFKKVYNLPLVSAGTGGNPAQVLIQTPTRIQIGTFEVLKTNLGYSMQNLEFRLALNHGSASNLSEHDSNGVR